MTLKKEEPVSFPEIADWVINRVKASAADCRVGLSRTRIVEIKYREQKPEVIKEATLLNIALEIFKNNRYARQETPDLRKSTLEGFVKDVIDNAAYMESDPFRSLPDAKYFQDKISADLQLTDSRHEELTPEQRQAMVKSMERACLQKGGNKVIAVEASEDDSIYEEYIRTTNGFEGSSKTTNYNLVAVMTADDVGGRRPSEYHYGSSRFKNDLPSPEEVGTKAAERTLALMGSKKIPTLTIPVIIENREAARVLYGLITPLMGSSIQQKMSFLADKKGKQIGSRFLTLSNDPLLPRGLGSRYYDYDNFSARKQTLFTEGTLNDFLIDWYYSRKLKCEPTSGTISNMIIPPGRRSIEEIIKDLGRCLLVTGFIGGNSNSTTGDFSAGINGKLFDKGAFVQNVAEMNIAGNHLNFWNRLVEVANDPWIYSSAIFPSLVIDQVVVSGI